MVWQKSGLVLALFANLILSVEMGDQEGGYQEHVLPGGTKSLCSPVTWKVGNYSPDKFYEQLMLATPNDYAEFSFEEMKDIYHYRPMDYWPLLTDTLGINEKVELLDTSCLTSLVSVNALNCLSPRKWGKNKADKAGMALNEIRKLYQKFYKTRDELLALEGAMKTLPSFAIFA